ncbi:MAG TPA: hypothetical protein ENK52_04510 [Saprospiraceae bacterium]|nr:hypothetical protein [Saprospiraceae bacterium]
MEKEDFQNVRKLVRDHFRYTASQPALEILNNWEKDKKHFLKIMPRDFKAALKEKARRQKLEVRSQ